MLVRTGSRQVNRVEICVFTLHSVALRGTAAQLPHPQDGAQCRPLLSGRIYTAPLKEH